MSLNDASSPTMAAGAGLCPSPKTSGIPDSVGSSGPGSDFREHSMQPLSQSYESAADLCLRPLDPIIYANFHETKDHWVLTVDLPGVEPNDINVSFDSAQLVIKAHRKMSFDFESSECGIAEDNTTVKEKVSANIIRKIQLPHNIDLEHNVKSSFRNGILRVQFDRGKLGKSIHLAL